MRSTSLRTLMAVAAFALAILAMQPAPVSSRSPRKQNNLVQRGQYLVGIAGCVTCHTPFQDRFNDPTKLGIPELQIISFSEHDALDKTRLMAGGRPFDLGPEGILNSRNLTPDAQTGLGAWSDDEIKQAIRSGISRNGRQLHPLMPYAIFNGMAESDLDAIVAYLRSLPPIRNPQPDGPNFPLPAPPARTGIIAPDPSDTAARGRYLVASVLPCTHCHTSVDNVTGLPDMARYLAGGQPYEGPWGIVYGSNITPDRDTGVGAWDEAALTRLLKSGVDDEGRRMILMPWQDYAGLSPEDLKAVIYDLRNNVAPVKNQVPAASLKPEFNQHVEKPIQASMLSTPLLLGIVALLSALIVGGIVLFRKNKRVANR